METKRSSALGGGMENQEDRLRLRQIRRNRERKTTKTVEEERRIRRRERNKVKISIPLEKRGSVAGSFQELFQKKTSLDIDLILRVFSCRHRRCCCCCCRRVCLHSFFFLPIFLSLSDTFLSRKTILNSSGCYKLENFVSVRKRGKAPESSERFPVFQTKKKLFKRNGQSVN